MTTMSGDGDVERRFFQQAVVIAQDVPAGTQLGIDCKAWTTGPRFMGIKMVPPGVHFLFHSAVDTMSSATLSAAPRSGFFLVTRDHQAILTRWSKDTERLEMVDLSPEEEQRIRDGTQVVAMASLRTFVSPQTAAALAAARTSTLNAVVAKRAQPRTGSASAAAAAAAPTASAAFPSRITSGATRFTSSVFGCSTQVRFAHIETPSFDNYKRDDSGKDLREADYSRRAFTYLLGAGGAVASIHLAKSMVQDFLDTMSASADVLALAKMEVDLSAIPEGKNVTFKWRGKPVFVRHRTQKEIDEVRAVDVASLRHKETDQERAPKPEWLVVLGICTHLGCVPIANAGDFGGYFCPCHGSHYDASGRIRKGPAPENLEIPQHTFIDEENKLVIG
ncbi:Rieske iron sulfur protein [Salpingoeca rosetta]|uniref:Rieske iron sulfur protein n=1 Tax=Salpingoeca rosetta (strain ATCC 50818 / BSB-021) TaxID=946362 RepID=F2U410_SALR5|nr:Rieske iron sulfur protein [Salpingoeca rosetta]EGD82354.1 Rieske iron sulfur protein [Salpingoeca rosetta]|eukprot:XP_004996537.1 Rieske iron sulfur protein [Salpingoeca rosetta]